MHIGSGWLPILVCLVMMAVCGGGLLLLGRWQHARSLQPRQPAVTWRLAAWADAGHKERVDG